MACCNYHTCLCQIAISLIMFQGKDETIREWIHIGDYVGLKRCVFPTAYMIGDSQSQDKMSGMQVLEVIMTPLTCTENTTWLA